MGAIKCTEDVIRMKMYLLFPPWPKSECTPKKRATAMRGGAINNNSTHLHLRPFHGRI